MKGQEREALVVEVAKAISAVDTWTTWEKASLDLRDRWCRMARAALAAREEPSTLRAAAQWVVDNWDRNASQGQSLPALRAALAAAREDTERPEEER